MTKSLRFICYYNTIATLHQPALRVHATQLNLYECIILTTYYVIKCMYMRMCNVSRGGKKGEKAISERMVYRHPFSTEQYT